MVELTADAHAAPVISIVAPVTWDSLMMNAPEVFIAYESHMNPGVGVHDDGAACGFNMPVDITT